MLVFAEGRKPENPEKKLGARRESTTNSFNYGTRPQSNPGI